MTQKIDAFSYTKAEIDGMFCNKRDLALRAGINPEIPTEIFKQKLAWINDNADNKNT